jgi:DNA-binding SARP family transcriptional activator/tetratricopeptide (TPR) repeat protein
LCVRDGGAEVAVPAARHRVLLAALVIRVGDVLSVDELAEAVWDGEPPPGARVTLRSYVKRLRQVLGPVLGQRIVARDPGYLIEAGDAEVDLKRFEVLCRAGCRACEAGAWQEASDLLTRALGLWRGAPLADIGSHVLQRLEVPRLEQLRLQAAECRIEAGLQLGHHGQLVPGLQALTAEQPLRERFHAQLMLALHRCGRRAEALAVYRQARGILVRELGIEPGPELRQLHQRILTGDPELIAPAAQVPAGVPRQLPAAVPHFAGRQGELAALTALLKPPGGAAHAHAAVVISAIGGTAGVGKTALAVHWAHRAARWFPDGQLYVNLRGYDPGQPIPAADALAGFLRALGVPGQQIPAELDERAARYRSVLSGRRVLVVLDNASDVEQVRPLLPGTPACMAVVTSRDALAGLIARDGAMRLDLDLLPLHDAVTLLRSLAGRRADEEPEAAAALAAQCARLPLALRIAAELAAARPATPLAELAGELAGQQQRLDLLDAAGDDRTAIRAVFSWSYQNLSQPAARLFRLLGLHPGPDVTVRAASSLASTTPARARRLLDELARAHLLTEQVPGRFGCHDLLRAYAIDQAAATGSPTGRRAALSRLLDYYLHTAAAADRLLYPLRRQIALTAPRPGVTPDDLASHGQALAWLDAEHRGLLAAISLAAGNGYHVHAWQLAFSLETFFYRRGHWQDWAATQHTALAAAHRLGDRYAQTLAHSGVANAQIQAGRPAEALSHLASALRLREEAADLYGQARVHLYAGRALESQGRYREALARSRQALRLAQTAGPSAKSAQAEALNQVGWDLAKLGRYPLALRYCQRAVALGQQLGNKHQQPPALDSLAYVHRHLGHHAEAADCYRRAVELFDELGYRSQKAETLAYAGEAYHADGNLAAARRAWEQALAILDDLHHPDAEHLRAKLHQPTGRCPGAKMIPGSHIPARSG